MSQQNLKNMRFKMGQPRPENKKKYRKQRTNKSTFKVQFNCVNKFINISNDDMPIK